MQIRHNGYRRVSLVGQEYEQALHCLWDESTPPVVCKIALNIPLCQTEQYI